ncbi:bifunctional diguanylate cyclase/phosphodiesterase [Sphingopyxis sp. JAI108]|uniref:putative bifunctional diguanylate cyclase/phosphodiesterase n=1 Tax=Sphingopyxis sp. JAI108 TaxID=2723060 RepID=UPI0015C80C34|nr:EAL domain-containing protein [Sphingopyxis sp. JAI108]NYF33502.1 diguanylate cyclase (GGDEF)-like protein [Sphingopyxis sp. JAI108]
MWIAPRIWWNRYTCAGETVTGEGRAMLRTRYAALKRQIPFIYAISLLNFIGFHFATSREWQASLWPGSLLIAFMLARLLYWMKREPRDPELEVILARVRPMPFIAAMLSLAFGIWGLIVFENGNPAELDYAILFGSLTALGCAYGLASFPNVARMPLVFLALPLAARLVFTGEAAPVGLGLCLILVICLVLRLLDTHERGFVQLVHTRSVVEVERARALEAEQRALSEAARVQIIANTDDLTGLPNRRAFLEAAEAWAALPGERAVAVAIIDLDNFKPINDVFGHIVGDRLLRQIGARLETLRGDTDMVARIGGDEFALLARCADVDAAWQLGIAITNVLRPPLVEEDREFCVTAGCGIALLGIGGDAFEVALMQADTALQAAKQRGRGEVSVFHPALEAARKSRSDIANALKAPGVAEDIGPIFQPVYELATMRLLAFEALARWKHDTLGDVSPADFVPIAEQLNLIEPINDALLIKAMHAARDWPKSVRLSVNLSAVQLCSPSSARELIEKLAEAGLSPARLSVEVTETALLIDFEAARSNLAVLKAEGIRIILDDFGAGFASIAYLREIRFDAIKLDGSLIAPIIDSVASRRLLEGVLQLCAALGTPCVAEHIESEEQLFLLRKLKCARGQGFLLGVPLGAQEAGELAAATCFPEAAAYPIER